MPRETTVRRIPEYLGPDTEIRPEELDAYEATGDWVMEPKVDGGFVAITMGDGGKIASLKSRDARTPEITGSNAGDLRDLSIPLKAGTILVGELEAFTQTAKRVSDAAGFRRVHLFDVLRSGDGSGEHDDLRHGSWVFRRAILGNLWKHQIQPSPKLALRFPLVPYFVSADPPAKKWRQMYEELVDGGFYEGVVLKLRAGTYQTHRSDGKTDSMVRCKKHVTGDFVYLGAALTPGGKYSAPKETCRWGVYCDGIECGAKESHFKQTMLAPAPAAEKAFFVVNETVCEFMGWNRMDSGALRHAQFVRVRPDKSPEAANG